MTITIQIKTIILILDILEMILVFLVGLVLGVTFGYSEGKKEVSIENENDD